MKQGTDIIARQPLPEYIPPNLFSDLALPEVEVEPPDDYDPAAETSLAVGMALNELAPGKVTLRWAVQKVKGLWIEVPPSGVVDLDARMAPGGEVVTAACRHRTATVPVIRPLTIRPVKPSPDIRPTSNGWLRWEFRIEPEQEGTQLPRPRNGPLGELIPSVTAFLNADRGPLPTWRYALGGTAEIVTRAGRERREYTFAWHGQPAGVGFANTVDAMVVTAAVPQSVGDFRLESDAGRLRQLRTDRFTAMARQGLEEHGLGPFAAAWVTDVTLSVAAAAVLRGEGIEACLGLGPQQWQALAGTVVDGVLLASTHSEIDETPLRDTVLDALGDPGVIQVLERTLPVLSEDPDPAWLPWLRSRFLQTLAAAWQAAAQQACLDFNVDADALVDVIDEGGPHARIVISDTVPGGGGLVEALTRRLADDPRRFDALVAAAVEPSDSEEVDPSLRRVLELLTTSARVGRGRQQFRAARRRPPGSVAVADRLPGRGGGAADAREHVRAVGAPVPARIGTGQRRPAPAGPGTLGRDRRPGPGSRSIIAPYARSWPRTMRWPDLLGRIAARPRDETCAPGRNWCCSACCGRGRTHAARRRCGRPSRFVANPALTERTLLARRAAGRSPGGRRR